MSDSTTKPRDDILDLIRGLSAVAVLLGHSRNFLFTEYALLEATGPFTKLFYFATSLGHQAVMIFFVLSGYFVGGSVAAAFRRGSFSWRGYALARLTRLWIVLLPALVLTACVDYAGMHYNPGAYSGEYHGRYFSGPAVIAPASLGVVAFLGNLFFLQTVAVPVLGTNGPLWSLANEFWYYLAFPLAAAAAVRLLGSGGRTSTGILLLLLFAGLLYWLPPYLVLLGAVWLYGVAVWWIADAGLAAGPRASWWWRIAGAVPVIGSLVASQLGHWIGSDLVLGLLFAVWMSSLLGPSRCLGLRDNLSKWLSDISYTLYTIHFPVLFFISAVYFRGEQYRTMASGMYVYLLQTALILALASGLWWLFERNTYRVRSRLKKLAVFR